MSEKDLKEILYTYGANGGIQIFYGKYSWEYILKFRIKNGELETLFYGAWCYICKIKDIKKILINGTEYYNKKTKFNYMEYINTDEYIYNTYLNYQKQNFKLGGH